MVKVRARRQAQPSNCIDHLQRGSLTYVAVLLAHTSKLRMLLLLPAPGSSLPAVCLHHGAAAAGQDPPVMTGCRTRTYGSANQCHAPHDTAHSGQLMFPACPPPHLPDTLLNTHSHSCFAKPSCLGVFTPDAALSPSIIKATCAGMLLFVLQVC